MKNIIKEIFVPFLVLITGFIFTTSICAQDLRIIKIKGSVKVREYEAQPWKKAKVGQYLDTNYELMTKKRAECTFSFGSGLNRVINLKENSRMKIADAVAGNLELAKGRVFSLIEKLDTKEEFQIRTPVAIAGVRGTGWTVEAEDKTAVRCFEEKVYVKGLDQEGDIVSETEVEEGSGKKVYKGGEVSDSFELTAKDKKEWRSFKDAIKDLIGKPIGKAAKASGGLTEGVLDGYIGHKKNENPFNR